ncbi:MAG: DMT family transporter [Acidobacteriaceae bacterium]
MFSRLPKSTVILLAFGCVYLLWGSTYGAIHVAGEHLPVPVVSATRSLISVALIVVITLLSGKSLRVERDEWWKLSLVGLLLMSCNNMLLTWGEKMAPSGFASLIISTMPILIALIEWKLPGGDALNGRGWIGTLLGALGIGILVWPSLRAAQQGGGVPRSHPLLGVAVLLGAALAGAIAAVLSRRFRFTANSFVATGWQIGAAGLFNAAFATATGGWHRAVWTWHGLGAIVYLSIFGSLFGLVAYTYLLQNVEVTKVSTYAFVNPVIAVFLGAILLHERLLKTEMVGMAVIVCGVAIVVYGRKTEGVREMAGIAAEVVE